MKALLNVEDLSGGYPGRRLFSDLSLRVNPGEVVGLIGPNGCGKTTLIRHVIGTLKPDSGRILLGDREMQSLSHRDRGRALAYLPQDTAPGFDYTLEELVFLGRFPHLGHSTPLADKEAVHRALKYVGLFHRKEDLFFQLSGGERQRGLFARALAQQTPLLVLDEPSSSLDLGQEHLLFAMLRELAREGRGVLLAVHNLNAAAEYCDRILLLNPEERPIQGAPEDVLTPENLSRAYRTEVRTGRNDHTGKILVLHGGARTPQTSRTVHLIGGAGSAVNLTRHLVRLGYGVTGGVAHAGDTDGELWTTLGVNFVREEPFSTISDPVFVQAKELVRKAWLTVLCDFPLGPGNVRNLDLAETADTLVILQGPRSVFLPEVNQRLERLQVRGNVRRMKEEELVFELEKTL